MRWALVFILAIGAMLDASTALGQSRECVINGNRINCHDSHGLRFPRVDNSINPATFFGNSSFTPSAPVDTFTPAMERERQRAVEQEVLEMERQRWELEKRIREEQLRQLQIQNNAGSKVSSSLGSADLAYYNQTSQHALETAKVGSISSWRNPNSGNSGTITPTRTLANGDGKVCREFNQTINTAGKSQKTSGIACRQSDGRWQVEQ